jgi:thiamine biosynthesis lipoprotein
MRVDLGGVAKGYAADQALAALAEYGVHSALVAVSGDIAIGQPPPGRAGWRITIEPSPGLARTVELANCGVSTSGDREQYLELDGVRYSHIVDPRTGNALTRPASTSVIAPAAMQADAIATSVCVLGHAKPFARMPGVTIVR